MQVRTSAGTEVIQVGSGRSHSPQTPRTQGPATGPGCDGGMFSKEREVTTASRLSREQRLTERDGECAATSKSQVNRGERENRGESKDATTVASPGRWGKAEVTAVLEKDDKQEKKKRKQAERGTTEKTWKFVRGRLRYWWLGSCIPKSFDSANFSLFKPNTSRENRRMQAYLAMSVFMASSISCAWTATIIEHSVQY